MAVCYGRLELGEMHQRDGGENTCLSANLVMSCVVMSLGDMKFSKNDTLIE